MMKFTLVPAATNHSAKDWPKEVLADGVSLSNGFFWFWLYHGQPGSPSKHTVVHSIRAEFVGEIKTEALKDFQIEIFREHARQSALMGAYLKGKSKEYAEHFAAEWAAYFTLKVFNGEECPNLDSFRDTYEDRFGTNCTFQGVHENSLEERYLKALNIAGNHYSLREFSDKNIPAQISFPDRVNGTWFVLSKLAGMWEKGFETLPDAEVLPFGKRPKHANLPG